MKARRHRTLKSRPKVLLLDDDPSMIALIRSALPANSFDLLSASSLDEATTMVSPELDIVLVDLRLPVGSGWDLIQTLRKRPETNAIPIVVITADENERDREQSLQRGVDRFLTKPLNPQLVRRTLTELLAERDENWWSLSIRPEESERLRELMFDPVTEVPTLAYVVQRLRSLVEGGHSFTVFCIELEPLVRVGERVRWETLDQIRRTFVRGLHLTAPKLLGEAVTVATSHTGANDFYCFSPSSGEPLDVSPRQLEDLAASLLREAAAGSVLADEIAVFVGKSESVSEATFGPRVLYEAVRQAKDVAERRESSYFRRLTDRLVRAIREQAISTVFQPILNLNTGKVYGYEALSRGPAGTDIESPEVIFDLARDLDVIWDLETLCIQNIGEFRHEVCSRGLLFVNLESHFIQQLGSRGLSILEPLLECRGSVVIEVTERSAIRDYATFRTTLGELQRLGFKVAVDDCGSGYATLEAVAELKPDFLKVGHSLFQNVEKDPIRRRIIDLVARCADTIGAVTIAEAIESAEQWQICRDLGIELGQGYLFARPAAWAGVRDLAFEALVPRPVAR